MKKLLSKFRVGYFCMMLCSLLLMTSCEKDGKTGNALNDSKEETSNISTGNAPKDVNGKTLNILNNKGEHVWTIIFSSNNSAQVKRLFYNDKPAPTNAKYSKTNDDAALLQTLNSDGSIYTEWALLFVSPNQGTATNASGLMTFTLF